MNNRLEGYFRALEQEAKSGVMRKADGAPYIPADIPGRWVYWIQVSGRTATPDGYAYPLIVVIEGEDCYHLLRNPEDGEITMVEGVGATPDTAKNAVFEFVRWANQERGFTPSEAFGIVTRSMFPDELNEED